MNDDDINKLVIKLSETVATKEDLRSFATKDDLNNLKIELKSDLKRVEQSLTAEIKSVGDTLSGYTHDLDKKVEDHEKRLTKIESLPLIAQ